jgi:ABC-type glycerol-3-phosphate transport system substrate-binding protein
LQNNLTLEWALKAHRTRLIAFAAAGLVALAGLTGCSAGSGDSSGHVTLTFATADPSTTWKPVITAYEKLHPDVTIKQLTIPYDQFTATMNQRLSQANSDIDLVYVDRGWLKDYQSRGFLADISDLKSKAEAAAVTPDIVNANVIDDKLYALEFWTTEQFMYVNTDILQKAGVPIPSKDPAERWTWDQVLSALQKIKSTGAAEYPFIFNQTASYYQLQPLGVSAGGGDGISGSKAEFSNSGWQKALTLYHDLYAQGLSPRGITNDKTDALFAAGKVGFEVSGPWPIGGAVQAKIPFQIVPAPMFAGGKPATSTDSWSAAVTAKSKNKKAAEDFLSYFTIDKEGSTLSSNASGAQPTQKDAFEANVAKINAMGGDATSNFGSLFAYELKNSAAHRPNVVGFTVFQSEAQNMFMDIQNGADPAARAKQADATIDDQLKRLG